MSKREGLTPSVVITYDPGTPQISSTIEAVKSHLAGMPVRLSIEHLRQSSSSLSDRLEIPGALAAARHALGAFSIEQSARGDILVFFTEPDGRSALIRNVRSKSHDVSVLREEAAVVVRSLVQALLEGRRIGMMEGASPTGSAPAAGAPAAGAPAGAASPGPATSERPVDPAPLASELPRPAPEERAGNSLRIFQTSPLAPTRDRMFAACLGYVGAPFGSLLDWQSGMTVGMRWLVLPFAYVGGSYTLFPQAVAANDSATLTLSRHPIELAVGYQGTSPVAPTFELAAMLDVIHRSTVEAGSDLRRTEDENKTSFGLGLRGGLSFGPLDWVRGTVRAGLDLAAQRVVFVARRDDSTTIVEQRLINPRIELGLAAYFP